MNDNKSVRLKIFTLLAYILLATSTGLSITGKIGTNSMDAAFLESTGRLIPSQIILWVYLIVLILLGLYTFFQSSPFKHKKEVSDKARDLIGWTAPWSMIFHSAAILSFFHGKYILMLILILICFIILLIANGNTRDDAKVFGEKLWVRNPFSSFIGLTIFLIMITMGLVFKNILSLEVNAIILLIISTFITLFFAIKNKNITVMLTFALSLISLYRGFGTGDLFSIVLLFAIIVLVAYSISVSSKILNRKPKRKLVSRAMPKYNSGRENELTKVLDSRLYKETKDLSDDNKN